MLTVLPYSLPKEFAVVDGYPCPNHLHLEQLSEDCWKIYYMRTGHPMMEMGLSEVIPGTEYVGATIEEAQSRLLGALNSVEHLVQEYRILQDLSLLNWFEWKKDWPCSKLLDRDYDLIDKVALARLGITNGLLEALHRDGLYETSFQWCAEQKAPDMKLCFSLDRQAVSWYLSKIQQRAVHD